MHLTRVASHWLKSPEVTKAMRKVTTVAQFTTLRMRTGHCDQVDVGADAHGSEHADDPDEDAETHGPHSTLVVVNTHLFYHPLGTHIRMLQLALILAQMEHMRDQVKGGSQFTCPSPFFEVWCSAISQLS